MANMAVPNPGSPAGGGAAIAIPRFIVGVLVLFAIGVMLYGVFMRYIMLPVFDRFDWEPISFFWVEEMGEAALAWITLIGAAIGVAERSHFTLAVVTHNWSAKAQRIVHTGNYLFIAFFGGLIAWIGVKLSILNAPLLSPGLEFSLAWLYVPVTVGGILIAIYAVQALRGPVTQHDITDVKE